MRMHECLGLLRATLLAAAAVVSTNAGAAAAVAPVAMVSDLQGKAVVLKDAVRAPLGLLADLDAGMQV